VAIGHQGWEWPLPSVENYFIYHEVAWSGNCEDGDLVYDACLQYDGDDDPSQAPHVAEQPCGVVFSDGSADAPLVYRERLTSPIPNGYGRCQSCPGTKHRPQVLL